MKSRKHDWSLSGLFLLVMLATYTEASRCFYHGKLNISEAICTDNGGNINLLNEACLIEGCYEECCDSSQYAPLSASRINNATICENCGYIWNSTSENCKTSANAAEAGFGQTGECDSPCGPGFYGPNCTFTPDLGDCCKYHSREVNETVCSSCNGTINENMECLVNHCYDECCSEEDFLAGSLKNPQTCSNCLDEWSYSESYGTGGCITRSGNVENQLGVNCNSPCGSGSYGSDCKNCCEDLIWFTKLPESTESNPAFAQIHCARCGGTEIRVGTHDNSPVYVCDIERCPCNTNISIVSLPSASELAELSPGDPVNSTCVSECCEARAVRRQVQNTSITNYAPSSFKDFCEQNCGGNITYLSSFQSEDSYQYSIVRCAVYEAGVDTCCGTVNVRTVPPEGRTCESCGFVTDMQGNCEATTTSAPTAPTTTTSPPPTAAPLSACCTSSRVNDMSCSTSCGMGSTDWQPLDSSSTVCSATGCCPERNYPYITDYLLNNATVDLSSTCSDCCVTSLYITYYSNAQLSYLRDACESYCGGELRPFDQAAGGYCRAPGCCRAENSYDPGITVQLSIADINSTTGLLDLRSDACLDCCTQSPYGIPYTMGAMFGLVDPRFSATCQRCGGEVRELGNLSFQQDYQEYTHYCYIESCCPGTFVGYDISNVNRTDVIINPGGREFFVPIGDITSACPIDCCAASPVGASTCGKCTASSANLWQALDGDEELCGVSECCSEGAYPRITGQLTNGTSTVNLSSTCSDCCVTSLYITYFPSNAQLSYLRDACESYCGGELRPFDQAAGGYCSVPGCCRAENSYDPGITVQLSAADINSTTGLLDLRSDACLDCCTQSPYGGIVFDVDNRGGTVNPLFSATCQRCGGEVRELEKTMFPLSLQYSHYCYIPACCGGSDYNITDVEITPFSSDWIGNISSACAPSDTSTNAPISDCCVTPLYTTSFTQTLAQWMYSASACGSDCGGELLPFNYTNPNAGGYCSVPGCCRAENSYDPGITVQLSAADINSTTGLLDLRSDSCLDCCTQSPYGRLYEVYNQTGDAGPYPMPGTVDPVFNATCQRCGGEVRGLGATMQPVTGAQGPQYSHYCYIPACCGGSDYNITDVEITSFSSDWIGNISSACAPSEISTNAPTSAPTSAHTKAPTSAPTKAPTNAPTKAPTSAPTKAPTSAPTKAPTSAPTTTAAPVAEVCLAGEYLESSGPCAGRCFPCKSKVVYNKNDPNFGESGVFPLPDAPSECQRCGITNGECDKNRKENNKCDELSGYYNEAAPCRKFTSTDNSWYNQCEWEAKRGDPELEIIIVKERIGQCYPCDSTYNPPDAPREILQCSPETCNVNFNRNTTVEMPTIKRLILNIIGIRSLPVTGTYLLLGLGIVFT